MLVESDAVQHQQEGLGAGRILEIPLSSVAAEDDDDLMMVDGWSRHTVPGKVFTEG